MITMTPASDETTLIQVPRDLVRACAAELQHLPGWRGHPLRSIKGLIYGLNSIADNFELYRYRDGFPQPSIATRELKGVRGLAKTAVRTGVRHQNKWDG